jgi:hypothetical protein
MEKLKEIQDRGPVNNTPEEVDIWHNQILEAANWELRGIAPKHKIQAARAEAKLGGKVIKGMANEGEVDEHKGEIREIGNYNPVTGRYESTWRKDIVEPAFVPGASLVQEGTEDLLAGQKLPAELQSDVWNPRLCKWEKAGYETKQEEED